jgi:hypothetical protein
MDLPTNAAVGINISRVSTRIQAMNHTFYAPYLMELQANAIKIPRGKIVWSDKSEEEKAALRQKYYETCGDRFLNDPTISDGKYIGVCYYEITHSAPGVVDGTRTRLF